MSSSPPNEILGILASAASSQRQASIFDMDIDLDAPVLPPTSSPLFTQNLFSRTIITTHPSQLRYTCQQLHCKYIAPLASLDNKSTSNLWKHYNHVHPAKAATARKRKPSSSEPIQPKSAFFEKRTRKETAEITFRDALVDLVVQQNLSLSFVDSEAFHNFIAIAGPAHEIPSARTLARDIQKRFTAEQEELRLELHTHMQGGGRFSLTTDGWGASNRTDYAAVTIHWIDLGWEKQNSRLLDMIHLEEPVHSGEYLARKLLQVTDAFDITGSVFTITRDNAKPNDSMLDLFAAGNGNVRFTSLQPWGFTRKEGDVRCMAHILNLAVQDALRSIKATPDGDPEVYEVEETRARLLDNYESSSCIASCLDRLRQHIYVFRLRRAWREDLKRQADYEGETFKQLQLDTPVRWSSTHTMIDAALKLRTSITALCATQQLDSSMHAIALSQADWNVLVSVQRLFTIFAAPTTKLQADKYPTLNTVIPLYLKIIMQLTELRGIGASRTTTLGLACSAALLKLEKYYNMATNQDASHSFIATLCDPRMNIYVFQRLWPGSGMSQKRGHVRKAFDTCFSKYHHREHVLEVEREDQAAEEEIVNVVVDSDDELFYTGEVSTEPEWERWLKEPQAPKSTKLLEFWRVKQYDFPVIAKIARDHLAIPATSASSERVFSRGGNIITKTRNRLSPETVRHLLCLQNWGNVATEDS